jgi:hypothetical protein
MAERINHKEIYKSQSQFIAIALGILVFTGLLVWVAIKERNGLVVAAIVIPLILVGGLRMAMQSVKATSNGIFVRNVFASRFISWREIERFELGRVRMLQAVCIIVLRDGSSYHASAIQASNLARNRSMNEATKLVDALNARLAECTTVAVNAWH